jgi:hypothetical protein
VTHLLALLLDPQRLYIQLRRLSHKYIIIVLVLALPPTN